MLAAPVTAPADKTSGLATEKVWLPEGEWIEWPTGKHFTGPASVERSFSIEQTPVYLRAGAIVPMQPPMLYTGEKPVDPLIVNVWPLEPGADSSYSVYEDSGRRGRVSTRRLCAHADQGHANRRHAEGRDRPRRRQLSRHAQGARATSCACPPTGPPQSVTVNGAAVKRGDATGKGGWSFEGNTLTTVDSDCVHKRRKPQSHRSSSRRRTHRAAQRTRRLCRNHDASARRLRCDAENVAHLTPARSA